MGAAHGGQILVSEAVAVSVRERLPAGVDLRELGSVRLRGLETAERVYQVVHPQLRQDFPALSALEGTPNNLPQQTTSFVDRERELAHIKELLGDTRLLTLLGTIGIGKTRMALQTAAEVLDDFPDGVWLVDLEAVSDPELVEQAVALALSVSEETNVPLQKTLAAHVAPRTMLLILDHCEHLIDACARVADALLRAASQLRILATSREPLARRRRADVLVADALAPDSAHVPTRCADRRRIHGRPAVRRARAAAAARFRVDRSERTDRGHDLRAGRRDSAGHRARGGLDEHVVARGHRRAPGEPSRPRRSRRPCRAGATAEAPGDAGPHL